MLSRILIPLLIIFFSSSSLFALETLSGNQRGILEKGKYIVEDDISVMLGNIWILEPGVVLRFMPGTQCDISGILSAVGTREDSIYFIPHEEGTTWQGIDYHNLTYLGELAYCVISGSSSHGIDIPIMQSDPSIHNCLITGNSSIGYGGGMRYVGIFDNELYENTFTNNSNGGVYFYQTPHQVVFRDCIVKNNEGGGIITEEASVTIINCKITKNHTATDGGGVNIKYGNPRLRFCEISYNSADRHGGGIYYDGALGLRNLTIVHNSASGFGGGVYSESHAIRFSSNLVAFNGPIGLYVDSGYAPADTLHSFEYNCFYGHDSLGIAWRNNNGTFSNLVTTNINGDSCDWEYNIYLDPQFVNDENDFHLRDNSPCIGAGHPQLSLEKGRIIDIGGYKFNRNRVTKTYSIPSILQSNSQESIQITLYPNPVNDQLSIKYDQSVFGNFPFCVFNILGEKVLKGNLSGFAGRTTLNMGGISTGMYYLVVNPNGEYQAIAPFTILH